MNRVSMFALAFLFILSACELPSRVSVGKAFNQPGVVSFIAPTPANGASVFSNQATISVSLPANTQSCTFVRENAKSITGNGRDGNLVVTSQNQIINTYTNPTIALAQGMTSIPVTNSAGFSAGDVVLFVNVRSGLNERKELSTVGSNVLNFLTGLSQNYPVAETQIVRLPQFSSVTINSGASITAPAFNGVTGGIVGFLANGTVTVNGAINVLGLGYAGGVGLGSCRGRCPLPGGTGGQGPGGAGPTGCAGEGGGGTNPATNDLLILGSGGAGGMCTSKGGNGGGIVFVIANSVNLAGTMNANGQAGQGGTFSQGAYAAGGGSGGVIHLEAQTLSLGTTLATAIGGAGGFDAFNRVFAGTGGPGLIRVKGTMQGSTNPAASTAAFVPLTQQFSSMNIVNGSEIATITITNLALGTISYSVVCNTDSTSTNTFTIAADTTNPVTTATATSNNTPYVFGSQSSSPVSVLLACSDSGSGCRETKFCTAAAPCTPNTLFSQQVIVSQIGTTKICFASSDNAGNTEATVCRDVVIVAADQTPPTTTATGTINNTQYIFGTTSTNPVLVNLSCSDTNSGCLNTVFCTNTNTDCVPVTLFNEQAILINQQGTTRVCFRSTDNANNTEPTTCVSVVLNLVPPADVTPPLTTVQFLNGNLPYIAGTVAQNFVSLTLNCTDTASGCRQTLMCSAPTPCVPNIVISQGLNALFNPVITQPSATNVCFSSIDNANNQEPARCEIVLRPNLVC